MVFISPSKQISEHSPKLGKNSSLPYPFQFIILHQRVTDRAIKQPTNKISIVRVGCLTHSFISMDKGSIHVRNVKCLPEKLFIAELEF
jgi:hypothetical protein